MKPRIRRSTGSENAKKDKFYFVTGIILIVTVLFVAAFLFVYKSFFLIPPLPKDSETNCRTDWRLFLELGSSRPQRLLQSFRILRLSDQGGISPPGWAWFHDKIHLAARRASVASVSREIDTSGNCSSLAQHRCCDTFAATETEGRAGSVACCDAGRQRLSPLPLPTRWLASHGRS